MNISPDLFKKYESIEFVATGTLFPINILDAVVKHVCPYCGCKLYEMRNKPLWHCRSKKHRNHFVISKDKIK